MCVFEILVSKINSVFRKGYRPEYRHDFEILIRTIMCFLNLSETPESSRPIKIIQYWRKVDELNKKNPKNSFWTKALDIARNIDSCEQADLLKKHFEECEWN